MHKSVMCTNHLHVPYEFPPKVLVDLGAQCIFTPMVQKGAILSADRQMESNSYEPTVQFVQFGSKKYCYY